MTKSNATAQRQMEYLFKFYRFFVEPKQIFKGKHYMILALYAQGKSKLDIRSQTGGNPDKAIALCEEVRTSTSSVSEKVQGKKMKPESFLKKKLSDDDVCRAFGAMWAAGLLPT